MSSEVDICNLALSHLGDEAGVASIAPPDGSAQAAHCGRFYPMARDAVLEAHPWPFAVKRVPLAEVDNPAPEDWGYAYALPSTCLRPLTALLPGVPPRQFGTETDNDSFPYVVETGADGGLVLYTNVQTAVLRFIDRVTDTTKYTPSAVLAISRLLAAYLAGPILKGDKGTKVAADQLQIFQAELRQAAKLAANVGRRDTYQTRVPSFIAARGGLVQPR